MLPPTGPARVQQPQSLTHAARCEPLVKAVPSPHPPLIPNAVMTHAPKPDSARPTLAGQGCAQAPFEVSFEASSGARPGRTLIGRSLRAAALGLATFGLLGAGMASAAALPTAPLTQEEGETPPPIQAVGNTFVLNFAQGPDEDSMSLYKFAQACQQVTGLKFTWGEDTEGLLKQRQVRLIGTMEVPKERFYKFFQVMMIISEFVCTEIGETDIMVIKIDSLQGAGRSNLRSTAIYVTPDKLQDYADQPATLITTVVTLPNTDVRQVSNSMRTMITDANTQQMLPAGTSNSMVLVGFGSNVVAMANMLHIIDEASKVTVPDPVFDKVTLEYASADEVQPIIEELLEAANQTRTQQQAQGAQGALPGRNNGGEAKITVDSRTNSLLITALPDDMPRIKELIAQLDVDIVERERSYHIYSLENVGAEDLADTLNEFLEDAVQLDTRPGGAANNTRGGQTTRTNNNAREFVVVADPETNSLLIAANRTQFQELQVLIEQLDRRQDQVLIETALIELTGSDFLDIGVELGFANIPGVESTGGVGVTSFGLSSLVDSDNDGIVDLRTPNIAQGVTAGIIDGDNFSIPALLSLLETKRNSNVLNVPSVLVNNNSIARVSTLDEQPTTTVTQSGGVGGAGTQENFADYVEAGITMEISPSISASRYLRLGVFLEVSTFIGTVQGAIPPPRITRTIETQINVPDGATMVIGGIVVDNESETTNQVPLLGDIPFLGRLFRRDTTNQNRTVLYFFVTPHILHDKDFADLAEISFRKKLDAGKFIGLDRIRTVDPGFGLDSETGSPITLEEFDLPLYSEAVRGESTGEELGLSPADAAKKLKSATAGNGQ